jgi:hypothetical protein
MDLVVIVEAVTPSDHHAPERELEQAGSVAGIGQFDTVIL